VEEPAPQGASSSSQAPAPMEGVEPDTRGTDVRSEGSGADYIFTYTDGSNYKKPYRTNLTMLSNALRYVYFGKTPLRFSDIDNQIYMDIFGNPDPNNPQERRTNLPFKRASAVEKKDMRKEAERLYKTYFWNVVVPERHRVR
jgi:hypothetical protein